MHSIMEKNPRLSLVLSGDKEYAVEGDVIKITILVENYGSEILGDFEEGTIKVLSILPTQLQFLVGTVKINGVEKKNDSIASGINIGKLLNGEKKDIEFKLKVIGNEVQSIKLNTVATFGYKVLNEKYFNIEESNFYNLNIEVIKLAITKRYSENRISLYDEIECQVELFNIGSLDIIGIMYKDDIGEILDLIENSFVVDNREVNSVKLENGIYIGDLKIREKKIISYKLKVISTKLKSVIGSSTELEYSYFLPNNILGNKKYKLNEEESGIFYINISNFKQINFENYLNIPERNHKIKDINKIEANLEISNSYVIKTIKEKSFEGQTLSGYKLIVNGRINETIEYTALNEDEGVHSENFSYPFGTYIILSHEYEIGRKIELDSEIENINYTLINEKCFYQNILVLISAKIYSK
ncbi:MAG: hypothetical protein ACRDAU_11670 [Clostridium sp.]